LFFDITADDGNRFVAPANTRVATMQERGSVSRSNDRLCWTPRNFQTFGNVQLLRATGPRSILFQQRADVGYLHLCILNVWGDDLSD